MRHSGIVVRFYYEDYVTFRIPLPSFARRALEELAARGSPHALPSQDLEALAAFDDSVGITRP